MTGFNVVGLDSDYNIVNPLRPTNVQWSRKYHEPGTFSIQIPLDQYDPGIKFIYTKDRPEMGRVIHVNYMSQQGYRYMQVSGYFEENELNRHVVYPKATTNITNSPTWVEKNGKAEDVAYAFFDGFKEIFVPGASSKLEIFRGASKGRGKRSVHTRNGEYLGSKIYDILKPSGMSYRILYDFEKNKKTFEVWSGIDRTEGNAEKNNPIVFSTKYGNIKDPNILLSEENYKNACIVTNEEIVGENVVAVSRAVFGTTGDGRYILDHVVSTLNKNDFSTAEFPAALENDGFNYLSDKIKTMNVEFDALSGSYEYMKDFDLGDKCTLEIPEIYLSADVQLIGCYEVIKSGQWSMSMEFGTPILRR